MKKTVASLLLAVAAGAGQYAFAEDPSLCLDCHEPAADWEGMSVEEILEMARDAEIKRHKDNLELSEEELRTMIELLMT